MCDVSILIPTYNRLWSLPKAVASCFETNLNIEVIVIDDGSTDGTNTWLSQQQNIIHIKQENQGKDWAVNNGFAIAKGKYVRFLDSDDWHLPYSTDKLFEKAEADNLDITCAGYEVYSEDEKLQHQKLWIACDDFLARQLGEGDASHYSAYLFKRDFIKNVPHRQEYGALDDRQFIIETAMHWPKTGYINEFTLAHRIHIHPRLQNPGKAEQATNHLALFKIYKRCFAILSRTGELSARRIDAALVFLWPLAHWIAKYDINEAQRLVDWIKELKPDFQIPEKGIIGALYRNYGFTNTEKLLRIRRFFRYK